MSRVIKFRAWDKVLGKMVILDEFFVSSSRLPGASFNGLFSWESSDAMQFTGLRDMDGVDIYEGDILERFTTDAAGRTYAWRKRRKVVEWIETVDRVGWNIGVGRERNRGERLSFYEVVGNVYENPELLS